MRSQTVQVTVIHAQKQIKATLCSRPRSMSTIINQQLSAQSSKCLMEKHKPINKLRVKLVTMTLNLSMRLKR